GLSGLDPLNKTWRLNHLSRHVFYEQQDGFTMSVSITTTGAEPTRSAIQTMQTQLPPTPAKSNAFADMLFKNVARFFAFFVFMLLAAIMVSLLYGSQETLFKYGAAFLWTNDWDPVNDVYGAVVPIIGTLIT